MRKMLTSKLKSNESLFLAAMQKHFALCLYSAEGQVTASSLPPYHTPTRWSNPSSQYPRGWSQRGGEQFLPHHEHFPKGKSVELLLSQNPAPSPWKRKLTKGPCSFSMLTSQKRPLAQSQLVQQTLSVLWQHKTQSLSLCISPSWLFPLLFPYHLSLTPQRALIPRGRERETEGEKESWI